MTPCGKLRALVKGNNRIRKVYLNGTITSVAGGGTETGDAPATSVILNNPPSLIAFILYGELLVADYKGNVVRKMDSSGFTKIIAGSGSETPSSNHPIPAKSASIKPTVIAYAGDRSSDIFIGDYSGYIFKLTRITKCYGVQFDNSGVCSDHGTCIGTDQCQ